MERVFHFHSVAPLAYFDDQGNLKFNEDDDAMGGDRTAVATGWGQLFSPKFVFKKQQFTKKRKEDGKVAGATLLEMVDLLLNQNSKLWPKFLKEDVNSAATKKALLQQIDTLCSFFDWKHHFYDAMGDIRAYTQLSSKNKASMKPEDRTKVLLGYADVTSSDGTGAVTRMAVRKHKMAELAEQKKKRKDERGVAAHQLGAGKSSNGTDDDVLTTENSSDKRKGFGNDPDGDPDGDWDGESDSNPDRHQDDDSDSDKRDGNGDRDPDGIERDREADKQDSNGDKRKTAKETSKPNGDDNDHNGDGGKQDGNGDKRKTTKETTQETFEGRRYSQNYLSKTERDYMEEELENERKDPSAMFHQLGKECIERAGRFFLQSEIAGRFMADKRKEHYQFWKGRDQDDFDLVGEANWRAQFHVDKREVVEMMWTEGDKQLAVHKDVGSSLMGNDVGETMGETMKQYADDYATWIEEEVSKRNLSAPAAGKETGVGAVSYYNRCIQMASEGADIPCTDFEEMKIKKPAWREPNWKDQQYKPLPCAQTATEFPSPSPVKSPAPKERSRKKRDRLPNSEKKTLEKAKKKKANSDNN